jgi:polar amino acid transport system substrate-binding protein
VSLEGVCTANGLSAANVAKSFGFRFAATDPAKVLGNDTIGSIFIATRHGLHAAYVIEALKAGKNVFVEKPLAMNEEELAGISRAIQQSGKKARPVLMVGFNRRFAPLVLEMKNFFANAVGPFIMNYRVHAGFLPPTHWTRDPVEGGGRLIGEVCHFVDLMQDISNSLPIEVFASPLGRSTEDDSAVITVRFANGSVGTITYAANGDSAVPKEHLEVFSTGRTAILDNFRTLTLYRQGSAKEVTRATIDKGHREEIKQFLAAVEQGGPSPVPVEQAIAATRATFRMVESLTLGVPLSV